MSQPQGKCPSCQAPNCHQCTTHYRAVSGLWHETHGGDHLSSLQPLGEAFSITCPSHSFQLLASHNAVLGNACCQYWCREGEGRGLQGRPRRNLIPPWVALQGQDQGMWSYLLGPHLVLRNACHQAAHCKQRSPSFLVKIFKHPFFLI